jgi:alkylation response protein AidB-like acyl-CoA dehydrogenase
MHLELQPADQAFRDEAATWLRANIPAEPRPATGEAMVVFDRAWQRRQYHDGWAGVSWPVEHGGRGLSLVQQLIWWEQYALAGAPHVGVFWVAVSHAGPSLITSGTAAQQEFHLPRILSGESIWCQGFSEPDAGSDLAAIRTSATRDGDAFVVNGQKIWTTHGQHGDFQELLVRTEHDPESRHKGLTWLICDMRTPGVQARPIMTMAGLPHFSEVFYDDVRIPVDNVVGGIGNGWLTAMSTLSFERGAGFVAEQISLGRFLDDAVDYAATHTGPDGRRAALADDGLRARIATARAELAALRATTYAAVSRNQRTGAPGPEGSMSRLLFAELDQRIRALAMDIVGVDGLRGSVPYTPRAWAGEYLYSPAATIGAGTSDIQRNIIANRVLGLPR